MDMMKYIKRLPFRGSFENVLFWGVLFFCFLAAIASMLFTATEGFGVLAIIFSLLIVVYFIVIGLIAYKTKNTQGCYIAMTAAINTVIIPPMFFICGAFGSGMPFYCLTSLLVTSLISNFKPRCIMLVYSLIVYVAIFIIDFFNPEISEQLPPVDTLVDQAVSFVFMGLLIFTIVSYLLKAYHRERNEKDKVIEKLNYLSTHDPLTGLSNRRNFIDNLCSNVLPSAAGYYLLMFDVDYFKRVNDSYGHIFGDQVLQGIGKLARETCIKDGEMAVRYGGEEFILLLRDVSYDKALVRAELFRHQISALSFSGQSNVHVNISGGFVDCSNPDLNNHTKLLTTVDGLLYAAKTNGRDQIVGKK